VPAAPPPGGGRDIARWYERSLAEHGYSARALGFGRRDSQQRRFEALHSLGPLHGATLLDVGCGFGDLLAWLHERGVRPRYTGLDICAPMIARCQQRFAPEEARFVAADVLDWKPPARYDWVVASGIFGLNAHGMAERIRPTLARLFAWCRRGAAVNFLSGRAARHASERLYVDPPEVLRLALALAPSVRLDHTYMPNDFTLFIYRNPSWRTESA
jgi:SAM-dependent methyltransferase